MNFTLVWASQGTVFDDWGEELDSKSNDLNVGAIYSKRQISWTDFINQVSIAVGLSTASSAYKELIAALVLLSMNAPKVRKITDNMTDALQKSIKLDEDFRHYIDITTLKRLADEDEVRRVLSWFEKHGIGTIGENSNTLILQSHTVHALKLF